MAISNPRISDSGMYVCSVDAVHNASSLSVIHKRHVQAIVSGALTRKLGARAGRHGHICMCPVGGAERSGAEAPASESQ